MKARWSLKFAQNGPPAAESGALERLKKIPMYLQWGKRCCHFFSVVFDRIFFILNCNYEIYKSLDEFEFRPDPTRDYRVSCP